MLPEFLGVHAIFMEMVQNAITESHREQIRAFEGIPTRVLYEGDEFEKTSKFNSSDRRLFEESVQITLDELAELNLGELIKKFADAGKSIGKRFSESQLAIIRKHAEENGLMVQQKPGEDLSETLLRLAETAASLGSSESLQLFWDYGTEEQCNEALKRISHTPELLKRWEKVNRVFFEQQRRREANRKLVE